MFNPHGFQNCDSRLLDRNILRTDWRTTCHGNALGSLPQLAA
jgi:hypothetical protein